MEFKVGDRVKLTFNNDFGTIVDEEEDCFGKHRQYKVLLDGDSDAIYYSKLSLELVDVNNKTQDQQKIEELEQRIEKLEKEVFKPVVEHDKPKEKSLLTEDERVILRNFNKIWKWIARDEYGSLYTYNEKPKKEDNSWMDIIGNFCAIDFLLIDDLFQFIKWTDSEPYNIEELLKGECGNE